MNSSDLIFFSRNCGMYQTQNYRFFYFDVTPYLCSCTNYYSCHCTIYCSCHSITQCSCHYVAVTILSTSQFILPLTVSVTFFSMFLSIYYILLHLLLPFSVLVTLLSTAPGPWNTISSHFTIYWSCNFDFFGSCHVTIHCSCPFTLQIPATLLFTDPATLISSVLVTLLSTAPVPLLYNFLPLHYLLIHRL